MNNIQCDVIKVFYSFIVSDDRYYELRLVRWTVNGEKSPPMFEKREYLTDKEGRQTNRCVGLKREDLYRLVTYLPELSKIMGFPVPIAPLEKMVAENAKPVGYGKENGFDPSALAVK